MSRSCDSFITEAFNAAHGENLSSTVKIVNDDGTVRSFRRVH